MANPGMTRNRSGQRGGGTGGSQQGKSLISELRRVQGGLDFDREFQGGPRSPLPARGYVEDLRAVRPKIRKAARPKTPRRGAGGALEVWQDRLKGSYGFLVKGARSTLAEDGQGSEFSERLGRGFENQLRTGLRVLLLGVTVGGGWASFVPLSGAVVIPGTLVAESNVKKIQHPSGGVVAKILVRDGMHVKEGDLLVRLDETQARSGLQVVSKELDETRARIARLVAERDGLDEPKMPRELAARAGDKDVEQLFNSEMTLFRARASARKGQKELLNSRVSQLTQEIDGLNAQMKARAAQRELINGELVGVQSLYDKHLVPLTRLTQLQRDAASLDGERGQLQSAIAETQSKISEAQLQMVKVDQDFRSDVVKDLREAQDKEGELAEKNVAARDLLNRIEIRAPTAGVVHDLAVHTIGGVVTAGEVITEIVPDSDELQIEAKLPINDIDQVHVGQETGVKFAAFNQRTTPELNGVVSFVSADSSHEQQGNQPNQPFYTVRVTLPEDEVHRLGGLQLVSGMPAEVFLKTQSRTMMSYLFKPITEQLGRAFTER